MDEGEESDDELATIRDGFVAVLLSKSTKKRIRAPWSKALIVNVYGRSMGFSFMQTKLLSLWKPAGRMDCVDLGKDFFLVHFSLKEDYSSVLRKGPWFFGDHFLSIRPWEPNINLDTANVSFVATWVRLNSLPIEYYEVEVLNEIGQAIGKVLRIDTHTALGSKGRYARLCVQIDVDKPLPTTILIGKLEQPISYEGIHKLCFSCGRVGHRKENCSYTIHEPTPPSQECIRDPPSRLSSSQDMHDIDPIGTDKNST
ncbi:hypothetical protein SO802_017649 [Lithocarpus litseifolius]|uniref:CCHC-type domain-containing protein n=1 Tax=Lithocarpus litseifolius TaxID=425828 RepID=A0AAW2CJ13_9ROSI